MIKLEIRSEVYSWCGWIVQIYTSEIKTTNTQIL